MTNFFKAAPDIRKTKRKPIKRVSAKRRVIGVHRAKFVAEQLALHPNCQASECADRVDPLGTVQRGNLHTGCTFYATEIHEPMTRARKPGIETILDADNVIALCGHCHRWTHGHPTLSEQLGLLKSSRGK